MMIPSKPRGSLFVPDFKLGLDQVSIQMKQQERWAEGGSQLGGISQGHDRLGEVLSADVELWLVAVDEVKVVQDPGKNHERLDDLIGLEGVQEDADTVLAVQKRRIGA